MEDVGLVNRLAHVIGCSDAALSLLISLLLGYPIAFFHRKYLYGKSPKLQHIYFIVCGISLCYFNYGTDVIHSFASISITYIILKVLGGSLLSLSLVFVITMSHLLIGYWVTATGTYDIKWTMPQCVLTLRLIGLAFNVFDGQQPSDSLSQENKKVALKAVPSPLEVFAHSYFPSSFLIGPQLPIKRYRDFVELKLKPKENNQKLPDSVIPGRNRFLLGLIYLVIYQVSIIFVSDDYFISEEFKLLTLWKKFLLLGFWGRITLYKYISCWLITEGSCILMGLTYNGLDENGQPLWDGCSNVKLRIFESSTKMNHYIESFNINTNQWVAQYIYKRLKFLNNKMLSHFGALMFLAVWHGLHSGYYATFFFEFIVMTAEKSVTSLLEGRQKLMAITHKKIVYPFVYTLLRLYTFVVMGYAMIPFILLKYDKYLPVFSQLYFSFHIISLSIIAASPFLKKKFGSRSGGDNSLPSTSKKSKSNVSAVKSKSNVSAVKSK